MLLGGLLSTAGYLICLLPLIISYSAEPPGITGQDGLTANMTFCSRNDSQAGEEPRSHASSPLIAPEFLFIPVGCFLNGLGTRVVLVYGLGYLDRNTPKKVFPVFLDACLASRYMYNCISPNIFGLNKTVFVEQTGYRILFSLSSCCILRYTLIANMLNITEI
jgi:hypothetical protein